jgi:hypothetical protein
VRGRSAYFLAELEGEIQVLDPATTELVYDGSPHFNAAMLCLEAQMRSTAPNDQLIHLGHSAVMNLVRYQLDPALQALRQPRQRILIADSTGLGKTLEAGRRSNKKISAAHQGPSRGYIGVVVHHHSFRHRDFT